MLRSRIPPAGMSLKDARGLLLQVGIEVRALIAEQYRLLNEEVLPALAAQGVRLVRRTDFDAAQRQWTARYFEREVRPLLMPVHSDRDTALAQAERVLVERGVLMPGDTYAITCGEPMGYPGGTNLLKVCQVS